MNSIFKKIIALIIVAALLLVAAIFICEIISFKKYSKSAEKYACIYGVEKELVLAVIKTESSFNENALSKKGAVGLMQLLPSTADYIAKRVGYNGVINLYDKDVNVNLGTAYLKYLLDKFGNVKYALMAYNAGEGRVNKWLKEGLVEPVPYKETDLYVKKVLKWRKIYKILP